MAFLNFFKKKEENTSTDLIQNTKGWYEDRYQTLVVQRNLFFLIASLCIIFMSVSVVLLSGIITKKKIEPMVIEVEESSGITSIVNPNLKKDWSASKVINQYFITTYLRNRETYNIASYLYNYNTVVRLLSSFKVYNQFKKIINDPTQSSIAKYGSRNSTKLEIRSILFLKESPGGGGQTAQIRFTIIENEGQKRKINKIASIVWDYVEMNLNFEDTMVNPLGFQVQFYTVSNDVNA
ncbi:MAG: type IV secretion system protein [Rickettsiales bacterium]|nr:type IV secretion system protein [Rickettsiales bacterium]